MRKVKVRGWKGVAGCAGENRQTIYFNAAVGFRQLEEATSIPANGLMRMFGPNGNPSAKSLFGVLAHLQAQEGVNFEIRPRRG
jgi:hypothetical protein